MRFLLAITVLFIGLYTNAAGQDASDDAQIITRDDLENSGITILSDIYQLIEKWNFSTIDGFNWSASANGLSSYQRQKFKIKVDDHPVDLNMIDNQNINLLPITVNDIDYIEVVNKPEMRGGDFIEAGLIHIHLKKARLKLSSHFVYSTGNETGDPGPYKFTSYTSPNIDKINTVLAGSLNYGSKNWYLQAGIKQEDNFDTDSRIIRRIQYFRQKIEKARLFSGFGKLSIPDTDYNSNLMAFYSDQNDYFHFKYYGNEIPVNRKASLTSLNGNVRVNDRIKFNYLLQSGRNMLTEWDGPNPDWNNTKLRGDLGLQYQGGAFLFSGGISLRKDILSTTFNLQYKSISFRNLYVELNYHPDQFSSHKIMLYSVNHNNRNSYKAALSHFLRLNKYNSLVTSIALFTSMPEEDLNYLSWKYNGYSPVSTVDKMLDNSQLKTSRTFTGDLNYIFNADSSISAEAGLFYRRFQDQYMENQVYFFNRLSGNFSTFIKVLPANYFSGAGINAGFSQQLSAKWRYKMNYRFTNRINGTDQFSKLWEVFPEHKIVLSINYSASPNFGIWSRLTYYSTTKWEEFNYLEFQSNGLYEAVINNGILWDIALKKFFSNRLIKTNIVLRNLLNQKEIYNPIGAEFNLRIFVQVIINLDNLPE